MKYIFVSGGVISGLGKGIITASLSLLLKNLGLKVSPIKIDMYLNVDAGTLRPQEHGETFVLASGLETDQDMGIYERFLGEDLPGENYITTGQIYSEVIKKERAFAYEGDTVEAIPHVTNEIINRIKSVGKNNDVVLVELGGTVGEYQNGIFFEAARILKLKNPNDVIHIHVTYLPLIRSVGELKSKPAQTSVHILNSMGIQPDMIVARSEVPVDKKRADKIALFCNIENDGLFLSPDVDSIYKVPEILEDQKIAQAIVSKLSLKVKKQTGLLKSWNNAIKNIGLPKKEINIGVVAKYYKSGDYDLSDSYISVVEAIKHASLNLGINTNLKWINSEEIEGKVDGRSQKLEEMFEGICGLIVPQGWGSRGVEGKITAIKYARENNVPYLGLCFGMQMAVIEFARNVCGLKNANSEEADPKTLYPVIHVMPDQAKYLAKKQYGGTIRLGQWPTRMSNDQSSMINKYYTKYKEFCKDYFDGKIIQERHRHRYEVNNKYRRILKKNGMLISGTSPDNKLIEAIELPNHPFFVGTQYHPELQSRLLTPHPLFLGFLEVALKNIS